MTEKQGSRQESCGGNLDDVLSGSVIRSAHWIDRCWKILLVGVLLILVFRDELQLLLDQWSDPSESHGLLIPAFSLYFIYQDRRRLHQVLGKANYIGFLGIILSLLWYMFWLEKGFAYPRQLGIIAMLISVVLFLGGWAVFRIVWLPILFLLFAIPIPARIHWEIAMPLRKLASVVASAVLNSLPHIDCKHEGVVIHGFYQSTDKPFSLNVAEACSGMRLLRTFIALGVAMAYLEYRPWIHRLVLLASTIPIAVFCNMLRVLITGVFHVYLGQEMSSGTPHMLLGMAMLLIAFGLYGLLAWIMNRIYVEETEQVSGILTVDRGK